MKGGGSTKININTHTGIEECDISDSKFFSNFHFIRLQAMRDAELMKDGDWMTRREAMRENLPPHFTNQDLHARLEKVSLHPSNSAASRKKK